MKKFNILLSIISILIGCSQENISEKYAQSITSKELSELIYEFSSDKFEGRNTGDPGQKLAVEFIRSFYLENNIDKADNTDEYFQKFLVDFKSRQVRSPDNKNFSDINWVKTENVAAIIEGDTYPDEYIVLTAHLDHVGTANGEIFNGADDDP